MVMIASLALLLLTVLPLDLLFLDTFFGDDVFLPSNDLGLLVKIALFALSSFMMIILFSYSDTILGDLATFGFRVLELFNVVFVRGRNKLKIMMIRSISTPAAAHVLQNDDLLMEILLHLPAKSLLGFKSVSKRWRALISSPQFAVIWETRPVSGFFLQNTRSYPDMFSRPRDYTFVSLSNVQAIPNSDASRFPNLKSYKLGNTRMVNSCNGLLLLEQGCFKFTVYNPTNNKRKTLPVLDHVGVTKQLLEGAILAFDPSKSPHYKVFVCIKDRSTWLDERFHFEMYSSRTRAWRRFEDEGDALGSIRYLDYYFPMGHFWNGVIIWQGNHNKLYVFDVDEEHVREIPFPRLLDVMYMGQSEGRLNLVLRGSNTGYEVLELEKDFNKFSLKCHVELIKVLKETPWIPIVNPERYNDVPWFYSFNILTLVHGKNEDLQGSYLVFLINRNLVMSYNMKNHRLGYLGKLPWKLEGVLQNDVHHYNISLSHVL